MIDDSARNATVRRSVHTARPCVRRDLGTFPQQAHPAYWAQDALLAKY